MPYRTAAEEAANKRDRYDLYLQAIRQAGGEPVEVSLGLVRAERERLMESLDAVVLPGSPVDVDPARYGAPRHAQCADPDPQREQTDAALLDHAFSAHKPVLAICYGVQSLNVYLGGTLIQDISSRLHSPIRHSKEGLPPGAADPRHAARIDPGSKLAALAGAADAEVNSSHHQSIEAPGRGLRITARAPDGVVEAVEWRGDGAAGNWVVGVQWHPERMPGDRLAVRLFAELIAAARGAAVQK